MRKILLVEDEDILRDAYQMILSTQPYDIYTATNGREALEHCVQTEFDLILLDLMMPVLDGLGFLEQFVVDDHPQTKIIIMSNLSTGTELSQAVALGAHKTMLKANASPRQLLATIRYELEA